MSKGFTLIEILLVVGIFLTISAAAVPISSNWNSLNNFDSAFQMTLSSLRKAQTYAIDRKGSLTWGVCQTGTTIRLFSGSCASPTVKNDFILPTNVTITGLSTVTFSQYRGEPSSTQSITFTTSDKTKTININQLGGFDIN